MSAPARPRSPPAWPSRAWCAAAARRTAYLHDWTLWNHVRTVASVLAAGLLIVGLATG